MERKYYRKSKTTCTYFGCEGVFSHFFDRTSFFPPIQCLGKKLGYVVTVKKRELQNLRHFFLCWYFFSHTLLLKNSLDPKQIFIFPIINVSVRLCVGEHTYFIRLKSNNNNRTKKCQWFSERGAKEKGKFSKSVRIAMTGKRWAYWIRKCMKIFFSSFFFSVLQLLR